MTQVDPYSDAGPIREIELPDGARAWLVSRYDEARQALNDPRLSKTAPGARVGPIGEETRAATFRHMLATDPPDHTRLRRLVSAAFTARRIEALRPRIQQISDDLLDALKGEERTDLIDSYAFPLPIQVICELLGLPDEDRDTFRSWTNVIVGGQAYGDRLPGAMRDLVAYTRELLAERRERPGDDLLSGLISARDDQDRLSEDELTSMVFLLLIAGHETTVNLIGNGTMLLLADRSRWERLDGDRTLLPAAIEEFLRYEGPVAYATSRFTTEPMELGGKHLPAGAPVIVGLAEANRDATRFDGGDHFDLSRDQNPHLGFGHGIHYCLGAPLARLEAQIAFTGLLDRFPRMRLDGAVEDLRWRPGMLLRGLFHLPVTL
ncbi:cytochrome P450 [Actinoplanes sp. NPDC051411]|uniref:cytochrome P450 family protein n=1 Tax=Actinoplanes sp. NPDC051411 TaxID=3155522 RepID=UPI00343BC415